MIYFSGQVSAMTPNFDGILNEWIEPYVVDLGTQAGPTTGSYRFLATWDQVNLYLATDRSSTGRYLGDSAGTNDSFFVAIDTDGIAGSGATLDGYGRVNFGGRLLPDLIYYFAGGAGWYESSTWTGTGWNWNGWTNSGTYYGWQPENPDDEFTIALSLIGGSHEVMVWAWMTPEANGTIQASWPAGYTGTSPLMRDGIIIREESVTARLSQDPDPNNYEEGVLISGLVLSWTVAHDANDIGIVDPNLVACDVYVGTAADPNLIYQGTVTTWDSETLRALFPFAGALTDMTYYWRVDSVLDSEEVFEGDVWVFYTEVTNPEIREDPAYQVVPEGGTADFTVTVQSVSTPTATWYRVGVSEPLEDGDDGGDISISPDTLTLSIADAELADEGGYYCVVTNASAFSDTSEPALLGIRRRLAYWPFEAGNADSTVAGSPVSFLYHDPNFVSGGIAGDAMEFDTEEGTEDILYTDPDEASYFDICNASMTAACWIKSSFAATWGPLVARNGEDEVGWQLRHNGATLDRVCFTTRGTGNDDGTPSNRTVYNGNWHYVVGTYDGTEKKVYIDGVVSRVYSSDDGSIARDSDAAGGLISATLSPVALAGRVKGDPINGLIFEDYSVTPCILDEVEIYNYALDAATIAQTYADLADTAVCPAPQMYDLDGDCIVNLSDLAKLAAEWLSDISVQPAP